MDLRISDSNKLLALHRALMEAKFTSIANDEDVAGSSYVAEIATEVVDVLIQIEIKNERHDSVERWNKWLEIDSTRREWAIALSKAKKANYWENWTIQEKELYSKILLSPFKVSPILLQEFIKHVDNTHAG